MNAHTQRGFTLYELLITVLIVGVLLTIGVPNLSEFTANSRISSTANDLHSSFLLARSEAARAKANVTICTSANSMAAAAQCDGSPFDSGWIIFVDVDGDISVDDPADEPILRRHGPVPDAIDISPVNGATYFSFAPTGLGRGDVNGAAFQTAFICDDRGNQIAGGGWSAARFLVVTPIGRATIMRDVAQINNAGGCP
ncbi:MAG: GspH/FimT family pseudopilin [Woeseiaceae bacterium]|nr:GspH/FimT family pseudopilin [Woeseiaceae bacterium]